MLINDTAIDEAPIDDIAGAFRLGFTSVKTETVDLYDVRKLLAWIVTGTDAPTLFDEFVKNVIGGGGPNIYTKVMTDTLTMIDALIEYLRRRRESIDAMTIDDEPTRTIIMQLNDFGIDVTDDDVRKLIRGRVTSDTVDLSDGFIQWRRLRRSADESLTLLDQFSKLVQGSGTIYTRVLSEAVEFSDGFIRYLRYRRTTDDALDLIDAFSKLISSGGITYARILSDSVTMIDDTGNRWTFRRNQMTDALSLSDTMIVGAMRGRVVQDAIAFTDTFTKWLRLVRQFGDDIEFSDGMVKIRNMVRAFADTLDLTDEKIQTLFLDHLAPTDIDFGIGSAPFIFRVGDNPYAMSISSNPYRFGVQ